MRARSVAMIGMHHLHVFQSAVPEIQPGGSGGAPSGGLSSKDSGDRAPVTVASTSSTYTVLPAKPESVMTWRTGATPPASVAVTV